MSPSPINRIIDENLNRLAEGLRVLEDIARMVLDDTGLTQQLKNLRHDLIREDLAFNLELLRSRNSADDIGMNLKVAGESPSQDLPLIVVANSRRAQESLRVLEEMAKLPEMAHLDSDKFKTARFAVYSLEQKLVSQLIRQEKARKITGLYVAIDTQVLNGRSHIEVAKQVLQAGVKVIQLRDKTTAKKQLLPVAQALQDLCRQNGALFIVNDYLDLALAVEADGLHIGQDDLPVEVARRLLPKDTLLGVSAATIEQVRAAEAAGADYIGVGAIFPTSSKNDIELVGIERVKQIRQITKLPLVAIGGLNRQNIPEIVSAGADSVCVISAILNASEIIPAANEIIKIIEAQK